MTNQIRALLFMSVLLVVPIFAYGQSSDDQQAQSEEQQDAPNALFDERALVIDDEAADEDTAGNSQVIGFGDVLRMLLVLAVVILIIYVVFVLLKRASRSQIRSSALIHNVSSAPLGSNRSLHLIQVGEHYYLIGSSEHNVQLIGTIEDSETIDQIKNNKEFANPTSDDRSFKQRIRSLLGAMQKPSPPSSSTKTPSSPLSPANIIDRISRNHNRLKDI